MFLNHRPHSKMGRAPGVDTCRTCTRHLREGYAYCSLACKVRAGIAVHRSVQTTSRALLYVEWWMLQKPSTLSCARHLPRAHAACCASLVCVARASVGETWYRE